MPTVLLDESIQRVAMNGFAFPLGVYPVESVAPTPGFTEEFEQADGGQNFWSEDVPQAEDWEEWPDRFMFDVLLPADRITTFVRAALSLLPPRVYPVLDVLGNDAYREVDPYIAYDLVGLDRVYDAVRSYGPWLFEDGLVGFGAMSLDPFVYLFIDEHKIATIRVSTEHKTHVEKLLAAFDLSQVPELVGADAAAHEHRSVLTLPPPSDEEHGRVLLPDEIIDHLRDRWALQLNVDRTRNVDDAGKELGLTWWRVVARCAAEEDGPGAFAEIILGASSLDDADQYAGDAVMQISPSPKGWHEIDMVAFDRLLPDQARQLTGDPALPDAPKQGVQAVRWLGGGDVS